MSAEVTPYDFPEIRWQGHWIWVPEERIMPSGSLSADINPQASETHGLFRKSVHLDEVPDRSPPAVILPLEISHISLRGFGESNFVRQ